MLIKNGLIATEQASQQGDLRIEGGVISEISLHLDPLPGEQVVDATGKILVPGGVDVHTHMSLDLGFVVATDDFYTGTVAAACGGTTTIVDHMGFGPKGCSISHQIEHYHSLARGNAVIDYSFHGVTDHVDDALLEELPQLIDQGITSHKFYLTYGGRLSDREVYRLMERAAQLGVLLCVHPENHDVVTYHQQQLVEQGRLSPIYHPQSRPLECEAEAIERMILFAQMAGDAPLYIVHLSNGLGLDFIQSALHRGQSRLYAETCPQYLLLDDSYYQRPDALKFIISPPLRPKVNQQALWQGLAQGTIATVATDHCPFFYHGEKQMGADDFTKTPGGAPGVEARMALLYTYGVASGRISLEQFVQVTATNPAKLFGMYPQKGTLQVGSDADMVLLDPDKKVVLTKQMLHENTDYTPYEGMELCGVPQLTIARGDIVCDQGRFTGRRGAGRFIRRKLPQWLE